jgi:hypothetical protein
VALSAEVGRAGERVGEGVATGAVRVGAAEQAQRRPPTAHIKGRVRIGNETPPPCRKAQDDGGACWPECMTDVVEGQGGRFPRPLYNSNHNSFAFGAG